MKRQRCAVPDKISCSNEDGQSIVLIAFIMVGIIAFVGLATDAGLLFARSSQWSAAVDSAALAGVVDMQIGVPEAEIRAEQFLAANGWEFDQEQAFGTQVQNEFGIPEFAFTATIPVETFFLNLIGFGDINLTHSATAAYYSLNDIPLVTQEDRGWIRSAGQFIFGEDACTADGDPVSPRLTGAQEGNRFHEVNDGKYTYRILVPQDYASRVGQYVTVQLFDPDPHNNVSAGDYVTYIRQDGSTYQPGFTSCPLAPLEFGRSCVLEASQIPDGSGEINRNPIWLVRVDKVFDDQSCPQVNSAEPQSNNITTWRLYFIDDNDLEHTIASYTSNNASFAATDLKWVTPGVTAGVPTDNGVRSFNVNVSDPLADGTTSIAPDEFGNYNIFLEVLAENGTSQNTWDVWAGPPDAAWPPPGFANPDVDGDGEVNANDRNLYLLQYYPIASSKGVKVLAEGRSPVSVYRAGQVELPIAAVESADAGRAIYLSVFDFDQGAAGDTNSGNLSFYYEVFGEPSRFQCSGPPICDGSPNCNDKWLLPEFQPDPDEGDPLNQNDYICPLNEPAKGIIPIPVNADQSDPDWTFFGGNLVARYTANRDEHVWSTLISKGSAFLTK